MSSIAGRRCPMPVGHQVGKVFRESERKVLVPTRTIQKENTSMTVTAPLLGSSGSQRVHSAGLQRSVFDVLPFPKSLHTCPHTLGLPVDQDGQVSRPCCPLGGCPPRNPTHLAAPGPLTGLLYSLQPCPIQNPQKQGVAS